MSSSPAPEDLTLPRILCLHGGGVTGAIFKAQFRSFLRALGDHFRFVFVDAPFFCDEGVGVAPVYSVSDSSSFNIYISIESNNRTGVRSAAGSAGSPRTTPSTPTAASTKSNTPSPAPSPPTQEPGPGSASSDSPKAPNSPLQSSMNNNSRSPPVKSSRSPNSALPLSWPAVHLL